MTVFYLPNLIISKTTLLHMLGAYSQERFRKLSELNINNTLFNHKITNINDRLRSNK